MRIFVRTRHERAWSDIATAAERLGASVVDARRMLPEAIGEALRDENDVLVIDAAAEDEFERVRSDADRAGAALVVACAAPDGCDPQILAEADDWLPIGAGADEITLRLRTARARVGETRIPRETGEAADLIRYRELLYDKHTRLPTLPLMIEEARERLDRRGELTVAYIHFVWYSKIEEIFGWPKLDDVLETTAGAVREFYTREHGPTDNVMMVGYTGDDNFILFTDMPNSPEDAEERLRGLSRRLEVFVHSRIEAEHADEVASLCGIYVGTSTVFRNPKIRTERLIYRGVREAAQAARGAEQWELTRKIADLKETLREGAVFMEYHPIIVTRTQQVYGYEALARGVRRALRSPEVLFEVAEEANLIWELSRLLRRRAVQGIVDELGPDQYLFLNVDPHDFNDPRFLELTPEDLGLEEGGRVVLEITERTAISDYPRFQEYLAAFRERGFRFAVDDAGSGYAGLGSIANLAPDFIKLDMSLISNIDSNFLKQNLVETLVTFAEEHGAQVIAEGVERDEEFETVRQIGVHLAQGFLFHRPRFAGSPAA